MSKHASPIKEVNYNIGKLYETSLESNVRLAKSVNNLKITIGNLMAAESRVKDIIMAQEFLTKKCKLIANI